MHHEYHYVTPSRIICSFKSQKDIYHAKCTFYLVSALSNYRIVKSQSISNPNREGVVSKRRQTKIKGECKKGAALESGSISGVPEEEPHWWERPKAITQLQQSYEGGGAETHPLLQQLSWYRVGNPVVGETQAHSAMQRGVTQDTPNEELCLEQ